MKYGWGNTAQNTKRKKRSNAEHILQSQCVTWFRLQYPKYRKLLFSIPNGAKLAGKDNIERAKNWRELEKEGAVKGAADLFLSIPSGDLAGLYIEMKTKKGRQTERQKEFEKSVVEYGYGYVVPRTFEQFQKVVNNYLQNGEY